MNSESQSKRINKQSLPQNYKTNINQQQIDNSNPVYSLSTNIELTCYVLNINLST